MTEKQTFIASAITNLKGIYIITKGDFISHLKSFRMILLSLIFVLTILGGAYAFAALSTSYTETVKPEFLVWSFFTNEDDGRLPNDALVITTDMVGRNVPNVKIEMYDLNRTLVGVNTTDSSGRAIFFDVEFTNYIVCSKGDYNTTTALFRSLTQISQIERKLDLYTQIQTVNLDTDNVDDDIALIVLDSDLQPVPGATITKHGSKFKEQYTNDYGIFRDYNLLRTRHKYNVITDDLTRTEEVEIFTDDTDLAQILDLKGPDEVLVQVAGVFMGIVVPIIAIGLSFDSISREKVSKSIIFLLCRPIGKRSIAVGKFLGSLTAIVIPLVLISLLSVWIISVITDKSPDGGFVGSYILLTIVFIAIFILIQQIFSTLSKTTGTAILAGIGIWLFYFLFFGLIAFAIGSLKGYQFNSDEFNILANRMNLFSPSALYSYLIIMVSPTADSSFIGIPRWAPAIANTVWLILLFVLSMELFRKRSYL